MTTGAIIGWKGSKPSLIDAGRNVGAMNSKFKELNFALASGGKCEYDLVEFYKGAFRKAASKNTAKTTKKES